MIDATRLRRTDAEYARSIIDATGLSGREVAYKLGVHEVTLYRWCGGQIVMPYSAQLVLERWKALDD